MMHMHRGYGIFGGMSLLGIIVIGLGIYLLVHYINENKKQPVQSRTNTNRALDILDERYAKGEIDEEEYKRRKQVLKDKD